MEDIKKELDREKILLKKTQSKLAEWQWKGWKKR